MTPAIVTGSVEIGWSVTGLDHQPRQRQEIHIGDAVLEAGRYESGDRSTTATILSVTDRPA